ncbi:MAG TPA: RidA family protein [Vicinamibacteria bacterium]|nr:RidA family protein [Vicinamibacteria bacterium]
MTRTVALLSLGALLGAGAAAPSRRYIAPQTSADPRPFSDAVLVGDTLYLSGKIGLDAERKVPAEAEQEARIVLGDVQKTLEAAGMSMEDLVVVQVFCSDVEHYAKFNEVYRTFFKKELPARAFIGSGKLLFGARFEVQAIAVRR